MMAHMNYRLMAVVAALVSCVVPLFGADANAQSAGSYPEKTIRIIVPFPAGGATDIIARVVGERLSGAWNRPVVIENISGAAGAAGRTCRHDVRHHAVGLAARAGGQAARARRDYRGARAVRAGPAGNRRDAPRLRRHLLARHHGAGGNSACDPIQDLDRARGV